jgi:D-alanine-D-alanine ligase-like ATP-grasp enzyme
LTRSRPRDIELDPHAALLREAAERAGLETRTVMVASPRTGTRRPRLRFAVAPVEYDFRAGVLSRVSQENPELPGRHVNGEARAITTSKSDTKAILRAAGLSVPVGRSFDHKCMDDAVAYAATFPGPVCVKPNRGKKGQLVFPDRSGAIAVAEAFRAVAARFSEVVIEESVSGEEIRFFYVEPHAIAVKMSVKPSILGDGRRTILGLIEQKNRDDAPMRLADQKPVVPDRELTAVVAEQGFALHSVPGAGHRVFIDRTANGTRGGGHIECRDSVDQTYWRRVEDAFQAIPGMVLGALDMIARDRTKPAAPGNYWILEINSSPSLLPYHRPWQGRPQDVSGAIIDYLQQQSAA